MGAERWSSGSQNFTGALALKLAVKKLEGKRNPGAHRRRRRTSSPTRTSSYCAEGTWQEMKDGCNVFQPALVPNPGWFALGLFRGAPRKSA